MEKGVETMNRELNKFTAIQTENGYRVILTDNKEEMNVTISDLNEFANRYAKEMLAGKTLELNEKEEVMFSLWEMVLIPNDIVH